MFIQSDWISGDPNFFCLWLVVRKVTDVVNFDNQHLDLVSIYAPNFNPVLVVLFLPRKRSNTNCMTSFSVRSTYFNYHDISWNNYITILLKPKWCFENDNAPLKMMSSHCFLQKWTVEPFSVCLPFCHPIKSWH